MCSQSHCDLIVEVVGEYVGDDKAFTAFEVSLEVQRRADASNLPRERHRDMRNVIHQTLQQYVGSGVYNQELIDVGAPSKALLYFPPSYDPANYVPLDRKDKSVAASAASGVPVNAGVAGPMGLYSIGDDDDDDDDDDKDANGKPSSGKNGDARGCVAVAADVLRAAGFRHNDVAFVCASDLNGESVLILSKQVPNGLSKQTCYTVDHGNNVRITPTTLRKANVVGSNGYEFKRMGDQVIVKAYK